MTPEEEEHAFYRIDGWMTLTRNVTSRSEPVYELATLAMDLIEHLRKDRDGWKTYGQVAAKHADAWKAEAFKARDAGRVT